MILIGDELNQSLSEGLADALQLPLHFPDLTVFPDGERRVRILQDIVDEDVVLVKTSCNTENPDSLVMETALLIDAVKRSGAKSVTGVIPYLPYCRADHVFRSGEAVPLEVVINLYEKAGLSKILFVDPHTIKMPEMFSIEKVNITALSLFAEKIKELGFDKNNSVIVSPDMGGLRRMEQLSQMLDGLEFTSIEKDRDYETGDIKASGIHGDVKETCFIVDDIISSGRTIVQAIDKLSELGAKNIYVFATHPVFSEDAVNILKNSKAQKIFVTDAIPLPEEKHFSRLEILSLAPMISKVLHSLQT